MHAFGTSITYGFYDSVYPAPPNPPPDPLVDGYAARTAAALGVGIVNHGISGATMLGGPGVGQASILDEMLAVGPPSRHDLCVMEAGTNDIIAYGTDPTQLAAFSAGLRQGLLWITSHRRTPEPRTIRDLLLARRGQVPTLADGCAVFVGNCPRQSPYSGAASPAAQALYAAQMASDVAAVAATGRRVYLVDIAAAFDPVTQSPDGIHPSPAGHAAIAAAFLTAMQVAVAA
jgi:lysophospholipase L1-like esterase